MAWKTLHISSSARLSLKDRQVVIDQDDGSVSFPLEDIACIVLDTPQVEITGALLSAFVCSGIVVVIPDSRHHPAGLLVPFHQYYAQGHIGQAQVSASQPLKKRLWQLIVKAKILNQAAILARLGRVDAKAVAGMASRVNSGDPENIEAQAARAYWSALFEDFIRSDDGDRRNALLNYGYAVIRAALARACVAVGLLPALGLHHASKTNAFNLVDDLLEPFRPLVDLRAFEWAKNAPSKDSLSLEDRQHMAGCLQDSALMNMDCVTLLVACEMTAVSLVRGLEEGSAGLLCLPQPFWMIGKKGPRGSGTAQLILPISDEDP